MTEIQESVVQDLQLTPIQTFYNNSHIFITGATGFLGRVLLEKLLRSCPNISTIYILVRNKKGKNITTRVDELFDDVIFGELRKICPKFRHKVVGIEGDCCLPDLGLSDQDRQTLISKVDIIFHVAATVRFDEKMKLAVAINVKAPMYLVRMAKQMKNLKCFMHVSTAYSNCIQENIKEKMYPPPMSGEELIKIVDNISDKSMDGLTPRLLGKWPNTYTFTKAVAEHVVDEEAKGIPAGIFRPSIIISTFKEPIPAWINNMYGPTGICAAAGSGVMRTLQCDSSSNGNMVPVDMCTNSLIAAAWEVGTEFKKRKDSYIDHEIPVYHYESSNDQPITWGKFMYLNAANGVKYPTIKAIWYYSLTLQKNRYAYLFLMFFLHLVPAFLMDTALLCIGKQPMMLKVYKKIHKFIDVLSYFTTKNFKFESERVRNVINNMSKEDRKIFFCDLKELDWISYFEVYLKGVRIYLLQDDMKTLDDALVRWRRFEFLHKSIKVIFIFIVCRITWALFSVLLLRAGYVLIQIGSIPVNDVYSIVLHNILDITVTLCSYGLMGHMFSFGHDSLGGFIGSSSSFYAGHTDMDEIIYGFSSVLIGSALITTMLSGRVLPMTAVGTSFLHAGLLQPIVMHWIWHEHGWMAKKRISKIRLSVKDHAGGIAIHLHSGVAALCGSVCLGRRLVKLNEVHQSSLGPASPGTIFAGYIFVLIGLISFSLPYQKYEISRIPEDFVGIILINSAMALSSGLFIVILQCFCFGQAEGYWVLLKCLQGCTAGLITISSGIDVYNNFAAFFIASFGTVIFYTVTMISERLFYEDYCNIVPIHLFCGLVGGIFPPLLGSRENLGILVHFSLSIYHTLWQIMCVIIIFLWSTAFFLPLFIFLQAMGLLANKAEELNHQRSINVMRNIGYNSFWRIFSFSEFAPAVDPGSETKSVETLDTMKQRYELRRESLEASLARKHRKTKNPSDAPPTLESPPVIHVEEMVKDMGILDSERYPASYEEVMEKRLNDSKFAYPALTPSLPSKFQFFEETEHAAGDHLSPSDSERHTVDAEIHYKPYAKEEKDRNAEKRMSPRKNIRNTRRKRRMKRFDSSFGITKSKRK